MKRIRGQSPEAQAARLDRGCCSIHGYGLMQVSRWMETDNELSFVYVVCPRRDCDLLFRMRSPDGPADYVGERRHE